jgi:hypothetical protein
MTIRNRIKSHRRVRAGDLVPHEFNFRTHPGHQRAALEALYHKVGFARSLLAYELPDGRLKLIDGHLRRDIDPDMEVEVEVLDVSEDEARTLLMSIDPLAALAETQEQLRKRLGELGYCKRSFADFFCRPQVGHLTYTLLLFYLNFSAAACTAASLFSFSCLTAVLW